MAGISGMNNYSFLFNSGNTSNNNLAGLTSSLFGGGSSMLGDYAMIKSGTYKKLLTAYYKADKVSTDNTSTETTKTSERYDRFAEKKKLETQAQTKNSEATNQYLVIKNEAGDLRSSAYALNSYTLYKEKTAEDGTKSYDRDEINKAVKSFVSDYNSLITASSKVNDLSISSKMSGLAKETNSHADMLSAVGISIGKDNKLVLDEEKLASAEIDDFVKLFKGSGSYGDNISFKASEIARQANSSAFNATRASSYSQSGSYSVMGNTNSILNQLF